MGIFGAEAVCSRIQVFPARRWRGTEDALVEIRTNPAVVNALDENEPGLRGAPCGWHRSGGLNG
jgi:hypothetical protein